jgi:hypothetical protein
MADLDDILAGGASAPVSDQTQPEQQQPEQPEQAAPEGEATQEGAEQGTVPTAALHAERAKAKRYTEQLAEVNQRLAEQAQRFDQLVASLAPKQPQPTPPDMFDDGAGFVQHHVQQAITPLQQAMIAQREQMSLMFANEKHGAEKVAAATEALKALQSDRAQFESVYRQIMASPHPYGALVEWHGKHQLLAEIGSDPAAYRAKIEAELRAQIQQESGQQQSAQLASPAMPSNFATARNVGSRSGPAWSGPTPLVDIFASK